MTARTTAFRFLASLGLAAGLAACGSIRPQVDAAVVTAVPKDVERCTPLGLVLTHSEETTPTTGLDQLRAQAVQKGGNTVLVNSYALSTTGRAYACDPPLSPDGRSAKSGIVPAAAPAPAAP